MAENALETSVETPQKEVARERSTVVFPYSDLGDSMKIATGVHAVGGTSCQVDQLAAHLGKESSNSSFQSWLNSARIFGLVSNSQGTVTLTPLGTKICDPKQEQSAKVESFLTVPLYSRVYEKFKGTTLPPPAGLDSTMATSGVAQKQKETARRVFQRSAELAGFFAFGPDRLVLPSVRGGETSSLGVESIPEKNEKRKDGNGGDGGGGRHPLIEGLIKALPAGGENWPLESRRKWLQAAAMNFDFVYTDSEGERGSLKVLIEREDSAK